MEINPITRELIRNALVTIADNMIVTVIRTSRSVVVKVNLDFSASVCDANGDMVAQGLSLPSHLGATPPALKGCLSYFGDDVHPGDIMISNDPYAGGSHLNDVFMFKPVYKDGERIAILGIILHHTDMGGRVPGGNATDSTEIFQEGLRIPPSKLYEKGKLNTTLFRIVEHNVRVADKVLGDFRSQVSALNVAEREFHQLLESYSAADLKTYMADLLDYAEKRTRKGIAALPDATVEFTDYNDDDGTGSAPVRIYAKMTVKGDEIVVDFTGTSPQTSGALNPNYWFTASCIFAGIRTALDLDIPTNQGFYRPITVIAPEGCWVNPVFPAPFGARGQGGYRIRTMGLGLMSELLKGQRPGCPGGSEFAVAIAGYEKDRKPFLLLEFHVMTGQGGGPDRDGQDAGPYCLGNVANVPVEVVEAESPVLIEEYAFLPDTEGAGKYRGALGIVRQYRLLADEAMVQLRSDRQKFRPWGVMGGGQGAPGRIVQNPEGEAAVLPSKFIRRMRRGDVVRGEMPGSGGYGDPLERDPEAVLEDVLEEKATIPHARETYGVVIDPATLSVDRKATDEARRRARESRRGA
ncbi:MAG: hydantoinase B/oxoprolinase family protein [Proteobacteria bacterium]|nr:hydantoinase B/oxoprolinase family protein [Pseudomonadota bacterium]